ncbi:MAG: ATP-binding cassette domain-containing protein [Romboutsia sp.]|nr:ATP-binding cassette domain-containing protein [Romboutsia sp.]
MLKCLEIVIFIKSFKNISFTLNQGEIISLFWLSGSGISTILNVLTNLIEPTSGKSICYKVQPLIKVV